MRGVAVPESEDEWLGACRGLRAHEVQALVSGRRPGDLPTTPADESARRNVVRLDLEASTLALLRQAQDEHRRRTGMSADDDALITTLVQSYLAGGARASSGAPAQVMVTLCPKCRSATADVGSRTVPLAPAERDRLCCDAQVLPTVQTEPLIARDVGQTASHVGPTGELTSHVGPAAGDAARDPASHGGPAAGDAARDPASHVGPAPTSGALLADIARRAKLQVATELPGTIRRAVIRRHHGRCAVRGCTNRTLLHIHHCDLRSEGGTHDPERLLPLCDAHHRHVHDGRLLIDGAWTAGFRFHHADGTTYGASVAPNAARSDAAELAFSALCHSGFRQSEARAAVDAIRPRLTHDMPLEQIVRMAFVATTDLPTRRRTRHAREPLAPYRRITHRMSASRQRRALTLNSIATKVTIGAGFGFLGPRSRASY